MTKKKKKKMPLFYTTNTFHYNPFVNVLDSLMLNHISNIKPIIQLITVLSHRIFYQERKKEFTL